MALIDVLKIGMVMLEKGLNRVLVWFEDDGVATVALLMDDAVEITFDAEVLVALTAMGTTVRVVALREVKGLVRIGAMVVVFAIGRTESVEKELVEREVEVETTRLVVALSGTAEDEEIELLDVKVLEVVASGIETVIVSK